MAFKRVPLYIEELSSNSILTHLGLLGRVRGICERHGMPVTVTGEPGRVLPSPHLSPHVVEGMHPEQVDALAHVLAAETGCLVDAAMGSGKTWLIAGIVRAFNSSPDCRGKIVVTTRRAGVLRNLHKELSKICAGIEIGAYGGKMKFLDKKVMVVGDIVLKNMDPEDVSVLVYDEVHRSAGEKVSETIMSMSRARRIGLSGTVGDRLDGKELLVEAMFGPVSVTLTDQEAEDIGRVCPLKVYCLDNAEGPKIDSNWGKIRVERNAIWKNKSRNEMGARFARAFPADQQFLAYVRTVEHGNELMEKYGFRDMGFIFYHSDLRDDERIRIESDFREGRILRMIATDAYGEGMDPRHLMGGIDFNWETGTAGVVQRAGRFRRFCDSREKPFGVLAVFEDSWDDSLKRRAQSRLAHYKKRGYTLFRNAQIEDAEHAS